MYADNVAVQIEGATLTLIVDFDANKDWRKRVNRRCVCSAIDLIEDMGAIPLALDFFVYQPTDQADAHSQLVWDERAPEGPVDHCKMEVKARKLYVTIDTSKIQKRVDEGGVLSDVIIFTNQRINVDGSKYRAQIRLTRAVLDVEPVTQ